MELLAAEAQAKRRPPPPAAAALLKKAKFLAKRTTPFRGRKLKSSRSVADLEKRMSAARTLVRLSWSWAPLAGLAKGCSDLSSDMATKRLHRCFERFAQSFEAKVLLEAVKTWTELHKWCSQHAITKEAWPVDPMFLEDFLETFRDRGRSVPRAKYATLVFLERHVQAPLITAGIHVPAPAAGKKAVRGQATPLQPLMARHVRLAFQADCF